MNLLNAIKGVLPTLGIKKQVKSMEENEVPAMGKGK